MATNNSINKTSDSIADLETITGSNGNTVLAFNDVASAVNHLEIQNNVTTNNPRISPLGSDTNIGISLAAKGSAEVSVYSLSLALANGNSDPGELRLYENGMGGSHYVGFKAPSSLASSVTYTVPSTNTNGVLTNTSGTLSWDPISSVTPWVRFTYTAGVPTILDSDGIASLTDNNVGDTVIVFSSSLPDANYAVVTGCGNASGTPITSVQTVNIQTGQFRILAHVNTTTTDIQTVSAAVIR